MNEIVEYRETEMSPELARSIAKLAGRCFTDSSQTVEQRIAKTLLAIGSQNPKYTTGRRFVIWDGCEAIAHARTFVRTVFVDGTAIPVLALATVCTDPAIRGSGLGAIITQKAFQQVGQTGWPVVSLFQTPVAPFYEKLDCRIVVNRFVNLQNAEDPNANPWHDDTVMVYPSRADWPDGLVDLNGPDY